MDKLPRIATMPVALVQREAFGWTFQVYQCSAAGWAEVVRPTGYATHRAALEAMANWAAPRVAASAQIIDPPTCEVIEFKAFSR